MKPVGKDIGELVLRHYLDELHLAILDDFVGEVPPDVDVLGSLTAADDIVAPFNTRRVVLVDRDRLSLPESESAQKVSEVQDVTPYATSGALASSRDALRADSDLRAYSPCHRRDGTAGTPELIRRRHHRRAVSLSVSTTGRA